jgi:hypothetical protein
MVQPPDVMEIKGSPAKLLGVVAGSVLLTVTSAALALRWIPGSQFSNAFGWFGLPFFGLCTVAGLWRLLTAGRTVVTITPDGILDTRLAADAVPWSGVRNISTRTMKRQEFVVLAIDPSVEARLALTPIAKWSRGPNRLLGFDGLCVSAIGLKINHDQLLNACLEHWRAAGGAR